MGSWVIEQLVDERTVNIDLNLLVPEAVSGEGTRAARLGVQGDRLARRAFGLELALVDSDLMVVGSLDADPRSFEVPVAGIAALLISKVHKVAERLDDPRRDDYIAKDSLDMLRLLRGEDLDATARVLRRARRRSWKRRCDCLAAIATTSKGPDHPNAEFRASRHAGPPSVRAAADGMTQP